MDATAPVLLLVALAGAPDAGTPPPGLRCLARHYPLRGELRDGHWVAVLVDGSAHPFDDGRVKTPTERIAGADLEDMLSVPYRPGPIRPVTDPDDDPGRIRFDPLFRATYGATPDAVPTVPLTFFGQKLKVHQRVAPAFERVGRRLSSRAAEDPSLAPFLLGSGGTFLWRNIAGTDRQSAHSYGISLDLNVTRSDYWEWQRPKHPVVWRNRIPQAIVDAFEAEGFIWGGRWFHYDTMHFEYRPELLDPACLAPAPERR